MHQIGMPTVVSTAEISRKTSLGAAIDLCLEIGGYEPKQVQSELKLDKAQFSRWSSGQEGVTWPKLSAVMDFVATMRHCCGWSRNANTTWSQSAKSKLSSKDKFGCSPKRTIRFAEC